MERYFYAEIGGTPYEIGFQHGKLAQKYVDISLDNYRRHFYRQGKVEWSTAKENAKRYIEPIRAYDPDLLEEMQGLADGAGVEFLDILALNARSEVLMTSTAKKPPKADGEDKIRDGCTTIAATPEATVDGHTYIAHNWDWRAAQKDAIVTFKIHQQNKPDILMITEAGIIGKYGVNSAGIGCAMNALHSHEDADGVPLHIVLRGILNSDTLGKAIWAVIGAPNACPANYMLGSACGEIFDCERMPRDYDLLYPSDGILVHTNHQTSLKLRIKTEDVNTSRTTFLRYHRANKLIHRYEKVGPEQFKAVLSDHADRPDSICNHPDPTKEPLDAGCTVFNYILDLDARTMEICPGNACSGNYYKLQL